MRLLTLTLFLLVARVLADDMPPVTDFSELLQPGRHRIVLNIDGHDRKVIFITPQNFKPGQHLPLVFFFHGAGGSAVQAVKTYGWVEKADKENFFVAFPEGLGARNTDNGVFRVWRDGRGGAMSSMINDERFFETLLDKLQAALPVDKHRIYVTGFSNGAGMTFTLGADYSERIAAIAPVSSQSFTTRAKLARSMPVYFIAGTADPLVPYKGGPSHIRTLPFPEGHAYPPVQDSVDQWAKLDGCPATPQVISDSGGVKVVRYGPGHGGSEVIFTTVEGNGHHWPDTVEPLPHAVCGPTLDPFNATDRIWEFFQHHPLP